MPRCAPPRQVSASRSHCPLPHRSQPRRPAAPHPTGLTTSGLVPPPPAGVPANLPPSTALPHMGLPSKPALPVPLWPAGPGLTSDLFPCLGCSSLTGPCPPTSITGWASQAPGSSEAQSRHRARPLGATPAMPFANPGIQSAWVPTGLKPKGVQRRALKPVLDMHQSPDGPAVEAAVVADVGVPRSVEDTPHSCLTTDEHSMGPQVRAGWGPRCGQSEPAGVDPQVWARRAPRRGVGGQAPSTQCCCYSPRGTGRTPPGP